MGYDEALAYIESVEGMEALFVTYDKEVYFSSGFGTFDVFNDDYTIK